MDKDVMSALAHEQRTLEEVGARLTSRLLQLRGADVSAVSLALNHLEQALVLLEECEGN